MTQLIQAAFNGVGALGDRAYFFGSDRYRRYNWTQNVLDDGGTLPLFVWHLPSAFHTGIQAALNGSGKFSNYTYFFKGDQYVRYNWTANRVDFGPAAIAQWWHLSSDFTAGLDAALEGVDPYAGKSYFFKGDQYARYDWATDRIDLVAPLSSWNLPTAFLNGIDAAINGAGAYAGKAYFFKNDQFVRYDWKTGQVDAGYPLAIASSWPSLLGLAEAPQRRIVLYATIDPWDHHQPAGGAGSHTSNFNRLRDIVGSWKTNAYTDDFWSPQLEDSVVKDPHMLALFLSGSYTEWVEAFRQPGWLAQLDRLSALIRGTEIPILAVCGSHQLVARAYGGWETVGHVAAVGEAVTSIANEADGIFRAPSPRTGEVGVYKFIAESSDPILQGLSNQSYFVEYHHDQVLTDALPAGVASLLAPDGLTDACQKPPYDMGKTVVTPGELAVAFQHRPLASAQERCRMQALRYNVAPTSRLLYTTQFHPESMWESSNCAVAGTAGKDGATLIQNFLTLANLYWAQR